MRADLVVLRNNLFPSSQQAFNITGKKVKLIDNEFIGTGQDHYVIGDYVLLVNNSYEGQLQIHEVGAYELTAFNNKYDGDWRVHQYAATRKLVFDNVFRGRPYDLLIPEMSVHSMHNMYPYELTSDESLFYDIIKRTEYSDGENESSQNNLPLGNVSEFLEYLKTGSKIKRPEGSIVITSLNELINNRLPV